MVNVLTRAQARSLLAVPHVADVESEGMDDDRFFVHLKNTHRWDQDPSLGIASKAFSSYRDARHWVKFKVKPRTEAETKGY